MASLTIVVDGVEQRFPLEAATVTLGRGLESDIRLKDIKASRRHCQIVKTPKGYQCVDLSSGNGTYVNGVQIKQQLLDSGDKITIGSTTIAFEDPKPAPAKPPVKAPTGKVPAVQASPARALEEKPATAVSSKTATARIPTERVQVAPTRKVTSRVDAVKTASQGGLKPATQPLGKSASRVGKPAARTGGTRPRPAPEPAGRKKTPVLLVAVAAGILALGGGGWFWFASKDGADSVGAQIKALMKKADEAEKAERFDAAVQDYRKALDLCQGERYKIFASEISKVLSRLESRRETGPDTPLPPPKDPAEKGPDFEARRTEIAGKHKLSGDPAAADWGGAVKEWNDFLRGKPAGNLKSKVDAELQALHGKARQDLDRLKKRAEALVQENRMAEALDLLKQQKPRFENTELEAEIAAAIKQYDK